ncbi:MAG: adenosine deaminase [Candidatus Methanofastidiosia archaeon]|jgi:adenosine deaminase
MPEPQKEPERSKLISEIPKVELHLHLEGAIPLQTLLTFIQKKDSSITNIHDLQKKLIYTDFEHFIKVWIWKNTFITEEKDFEEITYQVLHTLSTQNVKYVEAFYSPSDFLGQGLTIPGITHYMIKGKEKAFRDFGIRCEFIMDVVRGNGPDTYMQQLDVVTPYLGKGVIGIGLGGSEQKYPNDLYQSVYKKAHSYGFKLTAHAGETVGPESIWTAINTLKVERIGHGVSAYKDPRLISLLKEKQIPLEMCIVSNIKTGVYPSVEAHPIHDYYKNGLLVTVNSDDPTMFNTSINYEYELLAETGFTVHDLYQMSMNGVTASFMCEKDKEALKLQFEKEWKILLDKYN